MSLVESDMATGFKIDDTFAILALLRQNGFDFEIDEAASVGRGSRLHLTAKPRSDSF
jgi:hypothetical protein